MQAYGISFNFLIIHYVFNKKDQVTFISNCS